MLSSLKTWTKIAVLGVSNRSTTCKSFYLTDSEAC